MCSKTKFIFEKLDVDVSKQQHKKNSDNPESAGIS